MGQRAGVASVTKYRQRRIVDANLAAADNSQAAGAFNIGTGVESSVLEMIEALGKAAGIDELEPEFRSTRPGELQRSSLDVSRRRWRSAKEYPRR